MWMPLAEPFETNELQRLLGFGPPLRLGDAAQRQRKFDVVFRRQPGKQAGFLEHHADPVRVRLLDRSAADADRTRARVLQPGHHHEQGRLAAAAGADQHHEAAGLDVERDVCERDDILGRGLEGTADIADLDRAGAQRGVEWSDVHRGYVRQWLHRVSTHLISSLKVIAITAIMTTPASSWGIWK